MIVQATRIGRKGGVHYLARHLLDKTDENERIEVLAGDRNALHDAQALADLKFCRYSIRHLSISPEREMTPSQLGAFIRAIDTEFGIGVDRPRLVVRHIKKGRSHFHLAFAEVDPVSFRVLDCRNDYARLEKLARHYEAEHGEHVQPNRIDRREARIEGFSDTARKRAERTSPGFDRTRLKTAFAVGTAAFLLELKTQGLRIEAGDRGAILVTLDGVFVSAGNRAAGVRRNEFQKFIEGEFDNARLIANQTRPPAYAGDGRTQHHEAPASPIVVGNRRGRSRQDRPVDQVAPSHSGRPTVPSRRIEVRGGQARPYIPAVTGRRREDIILALLNKELDELLRRALALASWIMSVFEPESDRLARQIEDARKRRSFPPAKTAIPTAPIYDLRRRIRL